MIKEEIKYYLTFDKLLNEEDHKQFLKFLKHMSEFNDISRLENRLMRVMAYYFLSHVDAEGNTISLEHHTRINEEIRNNFVFFSENKRQFLNLLFQNQSPLFFLDVDHTLTHDGVLSKEKSEFIQHFSKRDHVILSTGKISKSIEKVRNECGLEHNYYSCLNGSIVHKGDTFTILEGIGLISKKIIEGLLKTEIPFIVYYENSIVKPRELGQEQYDLLEKFDELYFEEVEEINYERVIKILTFIHDHESEKEDIVKKIVNGNDKDLMTVRTAPHCFEIVKKTQHKGKSMKKIAEKLNQYYRISIAVGDSMNDLKMLDYAGYAYVVSNASEELKSRGFKELEGERNIDIALMLKKYE